MSKVFVSYQFQDEGGEYRDSDRQIVDKIEGLVQNHGFDVVTGQHGGGRAVDGFVRDRVCECDGLIAVMTRRHRLEGGEWTVSDWVKSELQWARDAGMHAIAIVEQGAQVEGAYSEGFEKLTLIREDWQTTILELSSKIGLWRDPPIGVSAPARSHAASGSAATVRLVDDMATAVRELVIEGVRSLDVFTYVGRLTLGALRENDVDPEMLRGLELRVLVRDPTDDWEHPPGSRQTRRKGQIDEVAAELASHDKFKHMAHRAGAGTEYMRYWRGEPTVRVTLARMKDSNEKMLCLGFYPLADRVDTETGLHVADFSGTSRPVLMIDDRDLVADFSNWFDFMWREAGA